ncbi:hypothetical protein [Streptomyces sp. BE230]|uniref:hypothetical protein n=1 Tax=Streptomyces sp. BE230 TaxID=3002526 RepID=UPI002ED48B45|nr:hypothetical protein [Streptomyces sp. BE230]
MTNPPPYPMIRFRCTTTINGHEYSANTSLKRSVWDNSDQVWRSEHLDTVRLRFAIWVQQQTGIEPSDNEIAAISVSTLPSTDQPGL